MGTQKSAMASSWKKTQKLGEGIYGSVHLATCAWSYAAVKSTNLDNCSSLEAELGFLEKLRGNPYVVQLYGKDISQEQGGSLRYNLLMEYAPCGTLHDLIRQQRFIPESAVAHYSYLLLRGLSAIHEKGMVHCDIKPRNILVFNTRQGSKHLKLADFGLARYEWEKEPGMFRGTPMYGSPEAVTKGLHGKGTDVWSFGMTVLEMLYGITPMRSGSLTPSDIMALTAHRGPPEIPEGVSEVCSDFLNKCLEMEVEKRWSADMLLKHPFIRQNAKIQPPGFERIDLVGMKTSPFGPLSSTKGLFSPAPQIPVTSHYQLFPECGGLNSQYQLFPQQSKRGHLRTARFG